MKRKKSKQRSQVKLRSKRQSRRSGKDKRVAPRTAKEFFAKPKPFQDKWTRATHVASKMRANGVSLTRVAREFGIDPQVVLRMAGPALRKRANGRYAAKASDRLLRVIVIPTSDGLREIATRDSREATKAAEYWNAVHRYLATGDASALRKFDGKQITEANGSKIRLITDLKELDRQGNAGNLSFESIYPK